MPLGLYASAAEHFSAGIARQSHDVQAGAICPLLRATSSCVWGRPSHVDDTAFPYRGSLIGHSWNLQTVARSLRLVWRTRHYIGVVIVWNGSAIDALPLKFRALLSRSKRPAHRWLRRIQRA